MYSGWKGYIFLLIIWLGILSNSSAQEENLDDSNAEKVEELVAFLQFSLNTIGSPMTSAREKDIIITQSYSKFFRDEDVQVEDDLVEGRETVTNKDVQAYLKDVDFFFKQVSFNLEIEEVEELISESGQVVFSVRLNRNLNGVTIEDDTVNQNLTRYIEINYDKEEEDLKIVSFYTTKLSESEDMFNWWSQLSFEWRYIFTRMLGETDSVTIDYLKRADALDSLDLSDNPYLSDIKPIRRLRNLRYLDLSNTKILDLSPLRSHTKLDYVSIRNTGISDIDFLRYSNGLKILDLAGSDVMDLASLSHFPPVPGNTPYEESAATLNQKWADGDEKRLEEACAEFESLFIYLVMKQMRKTIPKSGLLDGGKGEEIFTSMMDEELSRQMSLRQGLGLKDVLVEQLSGERKGVLPHS